MTRRDRLPNASRVTQVAAPDRLQGVTIRPATPADSAPTYEVLIDAIDHLARTRGWRYGDGMTVVLTSAPWGRWDRCVTSGGDALL